MPSRSKAWTLSFEPCVRSERTRAPVCVCAWTRQEQKQRRVRCQPHTRQPTQRTNGRQQWLYHTRLSRLEKKTFIRATDERSDTQSRGRRELLTTASRRKTLTCSRRSGAASSEPARTWGCTPPLSPGGSPACAPPAAELTRTPGLGTLPPRSAGTPGNRTRTAGDEQQGT